MAKTDKPHPGHEKHLCYLVNMRFHEKHLKEYKSLVSEGQYVCKHCGRVARLKSQLCSPSSL